MTNRTRAVGLLLTLLLSQSRIVLGARRPDVVADGTVADADAVAPAHLVRVVTGATSDGVLVTIHATNGLIGARMTTESAFPALIIDLPEISPGTVPSIVSGAGPIRLIQVIKVSKAPLLTRIVINLSRRAPYRVESSPPDGQSLAIVVSNAETSEVPSDQTEDSGIVVAASPSPQSSKPLPVGELSVAPESPETQPSSIAPIGPAPAAPSNVEPAAGVATPDMAVASSSIQQLPMSSRPVKRGPWGRVSFYSNSANVTAPNAPGAAQTEFISSVVYRSQDRVDDGLEFGLDIRHSRFTSEDREAHTSIYDAFAGVRFNEGTLAVRGGHMWINDLGGLGSVAGALFEARQGPTSTTVLGRVRGVVFGGLEPRVYDTGYVNDVYKYGGYVALEGDGARKHVAGYVRIQHGSVTERSVLSFTNFLPVGARVFVYQVGEIDLQKPAGRAPAGLNYFFVNGHYAASQRVEIQGTFNRGRSIDTRGLSDDILAGRPVAPASIEGLLYQSVGGRATVEIFQGARVYGGYTRDKDNREDASSGRWLIGAYLSNLFESRFDVTVSDNLIDRQTSSYHSTYFSVGHPIGGHVYLTGDYTTSLSVVRFLRSDGFVIETRPETSRYGSSAVITLQRSWSILATAEYTLDGDVRDLRVLLGATFRFQQ